MEVIICDTVKVSQLWYGCHGDQNALGTATNSLVAWLSNVTNTKKTYLLSFDELVGDYVSGSRTRRDTI